MATRKTITEYTEYDDGYDDGVGLEPLELLTKDLKLASITMEPKLARFLVDIYYQIQNSRVRADSQIRNQPGEPHALLTWIAKNTRAQENSLRRAMQAFAEARTVGQWALSQVGVGPVLSAGLSAHIDITRAPTAGHVWNFAGVNPGIVWKPKTKRPYNARLKVLVYKLGESFVKVSGRDDAYYGKLYVQRKEMEIARNEAGELADQAALKLETTNIGKDTDAYKAYIQGKLPPAHVHRRATRWVAKLFLSHWHQVAYEAYYGVSPPQPYAIAHLGHAHLLEVPGWPM